MLPGIDHRGAGSCALADEVDAVVAERHARGLEVLDLLRQAVAREVDAVVSEAVGAGTEPSPYERKDLSPRKSVECLSAETTSGQSSRTEPSTPR